MSRYIDADKLKESMCSQCRSHCKGEDDWCAAIYDVVDAPTEDVAEVKHGKWIHASVDMGFFRFRCSECGLDDVYDEEREQYRYCPNCGARMDGDGK